jgi:hypothetical protein
MANVNVAFTAKLKYTNGAAATSVGVEARRQQDALLAATMATSDLITGTSNSSTGIISLTLVATDACPVTYKITLPDHQYFYLRLPKNAKAVDLGIITMSSTPAKGVKDITSQINPFIVGQDIASAATIVVTCDFHSVTGTTGITAITMEGQIGKPFHLLTTSTASIADSGNFKLSAAFTGSADDIITLTTLDGTNYTEVCRSAN